MCEKGIAKILIYGEIAVCNYLAPVLVSEEQDDQFHLS